MEIRLSQPELLKAIKPYFKERGMDVKIAMASVHYRILRKGKSIPQIAPMAKEAEIVFQIDE